MVAENRFLFCGGGTGGHLFPGIAIALAIRKKAPDSVILFVGTRRGLEERVLPRYGFGFRPIRSAGFKNLNLVKKLKALLILPVGIWEGLGILRSFRPQTVVGLGGYSALPVMIAAFLKRIRRVIQEQNAIPGLTNRLLAPIAHRIFISFDETARYFPRKKTLLTGNPVREGVCGGRDRVAEPGGRHLLVLGGSLGAHFINELCMACLPGLLDAYPDLEVHLQTGETDFPHARRVFEAYGERVRVSAFIDDMSSAYAWADFLVARAGATTLSEIAACGVPAILIPFPYAANDHQTKNARVFASRGAAYLMQEAEIDPDKFSRLLAEILSNPSKIREMAGKMKTLGHPEAADVIAARLLDLARSPGGAA